MNSSLPSLYHGPDSPTHLNGDPFDENDPLKLRQEIEELNRTKTENRQIINKRNLLLSKKERRIKMLQDKNVSLQKQIENFQNPRKSSSDESYHESENNRLKTEIAETKEKIKLAQKEKAEIEKKNVDLRKYLIEELEKSKSNNIDPSTDPEIQLKLSKISELENELSKLKFENQDLNDPDSIKRIQDSTDKKIHLLQQQLSTKQIEIISKTEELENIKNFIKKSQQSSEEYCSKIKQLKIQLSDAEGKSMQIKGPIEHLHFLAQKCKDMKYV